MKHIIQRTCMGCNAKKEKSELIRIVKDKENVLMIDETGKKEGRGAYICRDVKCLKKVIKNRRLEKKLKIKVSEEFYKDLGSVVVDK